MPTERPYEQVGNQYLYDAPLSQTVASSELDEGSHRRFKASNLSNGNLGLAWCEGAKGHGIGETVTLTMSGSIEKIAVVNGYARSASDFDNNGRVKDITIRIFAPENTTSSPSAEIKRTLTDSRSLQLVSLGKPYAARSISISINSVYPGQKYDDTCITKLITSTQIMPTIEHIIAGGDNGKGGMIYIDKEIGYKTYVPPFLNVFKSYYMSTGATYEMIFYPDFEKMSVKEPLYFEYLNNEYRPWNGREHVYLVTREEIPITTPTRTVFRINVYLQGKLRCQPYMPTPERYNDCASIPESVLVNGSYYSKRRVLEGAYYHDAGQQYLTIGTKRVWPKVSFSTYSIPVSTMTMDKAIPYLELYDEVIANIEPYN
jgi:hypothetical protein